MGQSSGTVLEAKGAFGVLKEHLSSSVDKILARPSCFRVGLRGGFQEAIGYSCSSDTLALAHVPML